MGTIDGIILPKERFLLARIVCYNRETNQVSLFFEICLKDLSKLSNDLRQRFSIDFCTFKISIKSIKLVRKSLNWNFSSSPKSQISWYILWRNYNQLFGDLQNDEISWRSSALDLILQKLDKIFSMHALLHLFFF